ncbi:Homeodomain-like DNA binding domain-containing transcription factor [Phycomyces blakesleeanus NRRL 1555(-)]|uniref:Homeodomain-like DNA binding domain-containing transcription factor n=1 Tax=Phycomyces blakesleeanus (strain ATCC 8743b / DSM 1359 / FGSC 10004 / NBRC 33097 / NRRL 1555) TaxID=763407 RepID=A0A163AF53_PHYB8|nr:Homeodomain-like DNA binding domain-containing transcription factor [Phycomyces blakesleeanus NRRL 1555(-)]OAD73061.1 Homeodomain-like DNA binding domain-containing transcription factor [Phycomyces blakesleeanus NRRL 1555(-)]|eukprot:XP_018291101.1 Homeodomain-like DNA binding domain-containing transcription factor [Phycomyces blakesleeanus NRRL 1555(-)]
MIGIYKAGITIPEIFRSEGIPVKSLRSIIKKYKKTGFVKDKPRSERSKCLDSRGKHHLDRLIRSDQRQSLLNIARDVRNFTSHYISENTSKWKSLLMEKGWQEASHRLCSTKRVGPLAVVKGTINAKVYVKIMETVFKSYYYVLSNNGTKIYMFQEDNVPSHTANISKKCRKELGLDVLDWPSRSPDLSPIENIWNI